MQLFPTAYTLFLHAALIIILKVAWATWRLKQRKMNDLDLQQRKRFLSSPEAAKLYRVTNDYIARLCRRGKLRGNLENRVWMVERESLDAFFAVQGRKASPEKQQHSIERSIGAAPDFENVRWRKAVFHYCPKCCGAPRTRVRGRRYPFVISIRKSMNARTLAGRKRLAG